MVYLFDATKLCNFFNNFGQTWDALTLQDSWLQFEMEGVLKKRVKTQNLKYTYTQTKGRKPKPWEHTRTHTQRATKKDSPRVSVKHYILPSSASNKVAAGLGTTIQQHKKHSGYGVSRGSRHQGWWESWGLCCTGPALLYRTTQWSASKGAHCLEAKLLQKAEPKLSHKNTNVEQVRTCAHSRILKKGFKMEGV